MKKFDESYVLLKDMVEDDYYPKFLVDKVKDCITPVSRCSKAARQTRKSYRRSSTR